MDQLEWAWEGRRAREQRDRIMHFREGQRGNLQRAGMAA